MDYQEALQYISSVSWKGSVPGLERITELMHRLGDPQDGLRFVHIGGTNGKGSVAAFLSHILKAAGYRTGLFISPFIEVFNERMQVDNEYITDEELAEITAYVKPFAEAMEDVPTEFELNTAIGFVYFSRHACDIVVLEVGMGGEFDATNVIACPEVAVITAIGLDHMEYLGDTLEKIAATKAGIIKSGCKVVLYREMPGETAGPDPVLDVITRRCEEMGAKLYLSDPQMLTRTRSDLEGQSFLSPYGELEITLAASYQRYNLATALTAVQALVDGGYSISPEQIRKGVHDTTWPGRFEILRRSPVFLVDGAHNPHGMRAAVKSLADTFPGKKLILIFGVLADKDYDLMLDLILPLAGAVFCVTPDNPRAMQAADLAVRIRERIAAGGLPAIPARVMGSISEAIDEAYRITGAEDVICAIGSLYMIGDVKSLMNKKSPMADEPAVTSQRSVGAFIDVLATAQPVPGGGGAAALCAAVGTALGNMVGALTVGKKNYADVEDEIRELIKRCDRLQKELLELADEDARAFAPLAKAYKLPAETEKEKAYKSQVLESCSKAACEVPLQIMRTCCDAIDMAEAFAEKGSRLAVSDAGCAAAILEGSLKAASLNVFINTKTIKDREYADKVNNEALQMLHLYGARAGTAFLTVQNTLLS